MNVKKVFVSTVAGALLLGIASLPALASNGVTQQFGPYASNSPDSGTCGNTWANDTMNRVFNVDTVQNPDLTFNVTEEFKNGTFVTLAGSSPEGCGKDFGGTVGAGVTGKFKTI